MKTIQLIIESAAKLGGKATTDSPDIVDLDPWEMGQVAGGMKPMQPDDTL
jgi:hypothetical protein